VAFLLFTFYMVTDPATTPSGWRAQVAFGLSVAAGYGVLMAFHVVFGLFFSLTAVCAARGALLLARAEDFTAPSASAAAVGASAAASAARSRLSRSARRARARSPS
jgi:hypothetical protein